MSAATRYNQLVVDHDPAERSSWLSVGVFLVVAYGLAWLACLPLWLGADCRRRGWCSAARS